MIISLPNVSKRLVGCCQTALELDAGLSRPALLVFGCTNIILVSRKNPSNLIKVCTP
jgi:hypothetical protein